MESNKNEKTLRFLLSEGYPLKSIICFLMETTGTNQSEIARMLNVQRPFINQVLSGKRDSKKVKQAISRVLGFDPWSMSK